MQRLLMCLPLALLALLLIANVKPALGQERKYEVYGCKVCPEGYQPPLEIIEVRNLQNEHWARDLEIEVKNISSKPIYRISLGVDLPNIGSETSHYGFPLRYGDSSARFATDPVKPGAVSLKPGKTYVFRIPEMLWKGFENYMTMMSLPDFYTQRVVLRIEAVNFGDGTGFEAGRYITLDRP
jgi:hypothetical protein